ncbi:MAG: S8 family serine peptidase [Bacteroidales bacterium]|nr:S8 family serine peptidase [Bacteroidales bacterium]
MIFLNFILLFCFSEAFGQSPAKYWVQFTHKETANYSVKKPEEFLSPPAIEKRLKFNIPVTEQDFPVSRSHIAAVQLLDPTAILLATSKWHNGATFYSDNPDFITLIKGCEVVKYVEKTYIGKEPELFPNENVNYFNNNTPVVAIPNDLDYGYGTKQIRINNVHWLHRLGYKGEGIKLQVQDGGFNNSDSIRHFQSQFEDNRVRVVKNFVQPEKSTFRDGSHGTGVWSCIAAYIPGELVGSAPACLFYLVQTEDARTEFVVEEDYWVSGIEFADSLGIDIHTSSLGYSTFDDSTYYRAYECLDGKTSRASLAADIAVSKGMIVINSAGNAGRDAWHYVSCPSDAKDILTVGAINNEGTRASFSSFGPTFDGRVKPDGAAVGWMTFVGLPNNKTLPGNGTSYSAPLFAGMVACLKQAFPDRTPYEIADAIRKSGSQYINPDTALGYGITDFLKAYNILALPDTDNLCFDISSFVITAAKTSFLIHAKDNAKVIIHYGLRSDAKMKTKKLNIAKEATFVQLPVLKLPKGKKYDFFDVTVYEGETEYKFVFGRE